MTHLSAPQRTQLVEHKRAESKEKSNEFSWLTNKIETGISPYIFFETIECAELSKTFVAA